MRPERVGTAAEEKLRKHITCGRHKKNKKQTIRCVIIWRDFLYKQEVLMCNYSALL